jgi:predicted RNA-binding Zn ribbon-like protein
MVAWRFVGQVLPHPPKKLKLCDGPNCSWLFLDTSKAGRRRWCDMADCGNAAKSRRHYARSQR